MIKFPKLIEVVLDDRGRGSAIRVDGQVLDLAIGREVSISLGDAGRVKSIGLTLMAEDIRIVDAEPEQ